MAFVGSLPDEPSLESNRKRAKSLLRDLRGADATALTRLSTHHPRFQHRGDETIAPDEVRLADAQLVIAREYGFSSWPRLTLRIEQMSASFSDRLKMFLQQACRGSLEQANRMLEHDVGLAQADLYAACATGDSVRALALLEEDPKLASAPGGSLGWPPILYVAFSRFAGEGEKRRGALAEIAERLLDLGADPNSHYLFDTKDPESRVPALCGATGDSNQPAVARLLLERGAEPNDAESIFHAAEAMNDECLAMLVAHGADVNADPNPYGNRPIYFLFGYRQAHVGSQTTLRGIRWLLEHGADPNRTSTEEEETALQLAVRNGWGVESLRLLLDHGADVGKKRKDGKTAYQLAILHGNIEGATLLAEHGGEVTLDPTERFLAECGAGNRVGAQSLLSKDPDLVQRLTPEQQRILPAAAGIPNDEAVRLLLEFGVPIDAKDADGTTALHMAAWSGHRTTVRILLAAGPSLEVLDDTHGATALGWVAHGSTWCRNAEGDYAGIAEDLIAAGALFDSAISDVDSSLSMASDEVADVLRRYGAVDG